MRRGRMRGKGVECEVYQCEERKDEGEGGGV